MFEVPGSDIKGVHITSNCVKGTDQPQYIRQSTAEDDDEYSNSASDDSSKKNYEDSEGTKVRITQ